MTNMHTQDDLRQMQSLPLDAKIRMTKERIQAWYDAWSRYEVKNTKTGHIRYITATEEPTYQNGMLKENEEITTYGWQPGAVYLSFSGGKDSTVLKHIIDGMGLDVPAVFSNTGLEYPEIQLFVRDIKAGKFDCFSHDVEILTPKIRFDEVLKKYGYPVASKEVAQIVREARIGLERGGYEYRLKKLRGEMLNKDGTPSLFNYKKREFLLYAPFKVSEQCCDEMKKKPFHQYEKKTGRMGITGTMAAESALRRQRWMRYGCNAFNAKKKTSSPMSFWTEQDVLHYLKRFNVPYCSVYGDIVPADAEQLDGQTSLLDSGVDIDSVKLKTTGCHRTGCVYCMFGVHREKYPNRFQTLKQTHPKQYAYCMKPVEEGGLGIRDVLEYIGVECE